MNEWELFIADVLMVVIRRELAFMKISINNVEAMITQG